MTDALRAGVIAIAREAAAKILQVYARDFDVEHKADESPLTEADLASHRCIVAGLRALTPDIPVLSEESAHAIPAVERLATMQRCDARSASVSGLSSALCSTSKSRA